jgi:hypothetical protein
MDKDQQLFEVWKALFVKAQNVRAYNDPDGPVNEQEAIDISVACFHTAVAGLGQFTVLNDIRNSRDTEEA